MLRPSIITIKMIANFKPSRKPFLAVFLPLMKPKMKNNNICKMNRIIDEKFLDRPIILNKDIINVNASIMPINIDNFFAYVIIFFILSPN